MDHIERFLGGLRRPPEPTRVLATVLFTDIVGSTERASRLGDRRWGELLHVHDELARRVKGSRYTTMTGLGHFPMCEDPAQFKRWITPVLDEIAAKAAG